MAHTENSRSRLNKDDVIRLTLDFQQKYDITLDKISKEPAELRKAITSYSQILLLLRQLTNGLKTDS